MLNQEIIQKIKKFENDINNHDMFEFYTFDEFKTSMFVRFDDCDIDDIIYDAFDELYNKYHCNNDNTIVLSYNYDNDEYLILNFEYNYQIITQNVDIINVNDNVAKCALYYILQYMFLN